MRATRQQGVLLSFAPVSFDAYSDPSGSGLRYLTLRRGCEGGWLLRPFACGIRASGQHG